MVIPPRLSFRLPASGRQRRFPLDLPLLLLLASIAIMLVAAFQAQDAVRSHKRQTLETLRDYTSFAAWSFRQHLKDELFAASAAVLQPVNHGNRLHSSPWIPPAADLAHLLPWDSAGCGCHLTRYPPSYFFAFTVGVDTLAVVPNIYPDQKRGVVVDSTWLLRHGELGTIWQQPSLGPAERRWIVDTLTRDVRARFRQDWQFGMVIGDFAGHSHVLAYRPMPTVWGDTVVYAMELPPPTLGRLFGNIIDQADLLPPSLTRQHSNREMMVVEIHDQAGKLLYRSEKAPAPFDLYRDDPLPPPYSGFSIRASIKPELADNLIIGGLPHSRLPFLLGLIGVAAILAFVALRQLHRAAALTRMRADFVAAVSHELRTPLAQIRLYLDTLRLGRASTDRQKEWSLENLDREATRLSNLVENVLRFATIGDASGSAHRPCDIADEIRQTVDNYQPLARPRRVTVALDLLTGLRVPMFRDAFRLALRNLLDNAVKYGPAGQTITVRTWHSDGGAFIAVEDQGAGIPRSRRQALWEPFQRGDHAAARAVGGSGIGLALVRDVVRRHGGDVWVEDGKEGGACFVLRLPGASVWSPTPASDGELVGTNTRASQRPVASP